MANNEESGRYAIAGFLYQLIATGFEAFEVYEGLGADDKPTEGLVVERFGQDAAVVPADGSAKKVRLIQYKYSSEGAKLKPSELLKILQSFLKSVREADRPVDQFGFELVTNRRYSPKLETLPAVVESGDRIELERLIRTSSRAKICDLAELVTICLSLKRERRNREELERGIFVVGARFGMFDDEIKTGIDELVAMLMRKAADPGPRKVTREEIHRAFTSHADPYELLSKESIRRRREDAERFKRSETNGCRTIGRSVAESIALSVLEHPVTVVVGDGGCGKSVAMADAVTICLQDRAQPPGFALVVPAVEANAEYIMNAVARWRNFVQHQDGQNFDRSINRLGIAFTSEPLLMICLDAIDERDGQARLPGPVQWLFRDLVEEAVTHHQQQGVPCISVVFSCRRIDELRNLTRGDKFSQDYNLITVTSFDDEELAGLADGLDADVGNRNYQSPHSIRLSDEERPGTPEASCGQKCN